MNFQGVCVCVCVHAHACEHVLIILEFLLYTLTLECTLVSVKDLGGILKRRILRGDERGFHTKPLKKAKGHVGILQTSFDPRHP